MKFFALLPLLASLSSLIVTCTEAIKCTEPDMIVIEYPAEASSRPEIDNFFMKVFDQDIKETKRGRGGGRQLEPSLRGVRNLCNAGYKDCRAKGGTHNYCYWTYSCGTNAVIQDDSIRRDLQQQVSGIPAEFHPELYNCVDQGNKRFVNAAKNATNLKFHDDDKPDDAKLFHCCLKKS